MENIRDKVLRSTQITPFQRRVYLELLNVPSGESITYGELARRIGCRSAQAVGQALKRNPFAPDVPCHRVVAADGSLGGYNGMREGEQIERKRILLEQEKRNKSAPPTARVSKSVPNVLFKNREPSVALLFFSCGRLYFFGIFFIK